MIRQPAAPLRRTTSSLRSLAATAFVALVAAGSSRGVAAAGGPREVMTQTIDAAFAILKDSSLGGKERRAQRIAELRRVADRTFDWSEIARSSLGVKWRSIDAAQRARFVEVFKNVLAAQYMDDIDRFQGTELVTVEGVVPEGGDTVVRTTLVTSSRERVPMDYRMRLVEGRWMVVDLSIEGVSLVNHFRKTFAAVLANASIDELIVRLQRQLPAVR